jgi:hypothetical protein
VAVGSFGAVVMMAEVAYTTLRAIKIASNFIRHCRLAKGLLLLGKNRALSHHISK